MPVTFGLLQGQPVPLFPGLPQDDEIKAVLVTHNETATGVKSDIAAVRRALDGDA